MLSGVMMAVGAAGGMAAAQLGGGESHWSADLVRLMLLEDANTRVVLIGTGLLGVASGVVGTFAMFRKRSLVGDAVAHAALPGICAAYLLVGGKDFVSLLIGALVFGVLAAWLISIVRSMTRVKEDTATALGIGVFFGLGIVMSTYIQHMPSGNRAGLDGFILGKAASMVRADAMTIAVVAGVVLVCVVVLFKEWRALAFDKAFAQGMGWPVGVMDLGLMGLVCLCTVAGLPAVGVVLMVAMLVTPGAAARMWSDRLSIVIVVAGLIGGLSGVVGTALSAVLPTPTGALTRGWPTGPMIVLTAATAFVVSMMFAPRRGVVSDRWRVVRLRMRRAREHVLRRTMERAESLGKQCGEIVIPQQEVGWWTGRSLRARGLVSLGGDGLSLTGRGVEEARRVTRTHRLWELFLIEYAAIASDHVHRDADELEHLIPAELLGELERKLRAREEEMGAGGDGGVPSSPHEIVVNGADGKGGGA